MTIKLENLPFGNDWGKIKPLSLQSLPKRTGLLVFLVGVKVSPTTWKAIKMMVGIMNKNTTPCTEKFKTNAMQARAASQTFHRI